ncbi:hypothetical protein GCM10009637_13390 [Brevibacterium luteolum]
MSGPSKLVIDGLPASGWAGSVLVSASALTPVPSCRPAVAAASVICLSVLYILSDPRPRRRRRFPSAEKLPPTRIRAPFPGADRAVTVAA